MITQIDRGSAADLIAYRLQRAAETLNEADYNAAGGYFNAAVNRLYYSCYYAASALMLAYGFEASTHKGIKTMIGLQFVKTGKLEARFGRIYQQLFENRQSGDYEDFAYCDLELFNELRPQAEAFINQLATLITKAAE